MSFSFCACGFWYRTLSNFSSTMSAECGHVAPAHIHNELKLLNCKLGPIKSFPLQLRHGFYVHTWPESQHSHTLKVKISQSFKYALDWRLYIVIGFIVMFSYLCAFGHIMLQPLLMPPAHSLHLFPLPKLCLYFHGCFSENHWLHLGLFIEPWVKSYLQKHGLLTSDSSSEHNGSSGPGLLVN